MRPNRTHPSPNRPRPVSVALGGSAMLLAAVVAVVGLAAAGLGGSAAAGPGSGAIAEVRALSGRGPAVSIRPGAPADAPAPSGAAPMPSAWAAALPAGTPAALPAAGPTACAPGPDAACPPVPAPTPLPPATAAVARFHVPILEYHRVKPPAGETGYVASLIVPPDIFAAQMDALAADGWHTITMGELGDDLRRGVEPAPRSFVVTLDDGYEDGYTYAAPILRRDGFVATYFVVAGRIGTPDHLTVAELRSLLAAGNEIGNHTVSHLDLEAMDEAQLGGEIYGASALIASVVGVWPQSFAYPAGLTDPMVEASVAATPGIETAVIQGGSLPQTWANRLLLGRIRVGPGTYPSDLVARVDRYQP